MTTDIEKHNIRLFYADKNKHFSILSSYIYTRKDISK